MYQQLKSFISSVVGTPGNCLIYVRESFGIASNGTPTASAGWARAVYRHSGTPPTNISVPIWFSWENSGHVASWVNGVIHSTTAQGMKTFNSISALTSYIGQGIQYLGWSEDVDGVRVVEPEVTPTPAGKTITLPANSGLWHLYKPGGPYNPAVAADIKGILNPAKFGGLTYPIVASLGDGIYRINSTDFGQGDLWTNGSSVIIN